MAYLHIRVQVIRYNHKNIIRDQTYGGDDWCGIILGSRTALQVQSGTLTGHFYQVFILQQHVCLARVADDNSHLQALLANDWK